MHGISPIDPGRTLDWSKSAEDYARFRPGYPESFWRRLDALDLGRPGQRVLDLGTGTGNLARVFSHRGCRVVGVDVAPGQIEAARLLAAEQGLAVDFRVAPAEATSLPDASFDLVTASQCWLYFDKSRVIPEVRRLLAPGGRLLTCHVSWLPRQDEIARRSEEVVLRHNPRWTAGDWHGFITPMPAWTEGQFDLQAMFWYDEPLPFTHVTWRGRMRACRGVGASLESEAVQAFDAELADVLARAAPDPFTVLHRIDAHLFVPAGAGR